MRRILPSHPPSVRTPHGMALGMEFGMEFGIGMEFRFKFRFRFWFYFAPSRMRPHATACDRIRAHTSACGRTKKPDLRRDEVRLNDHSAERNGIDRRRHRTSDKPVLSYEQTAFSMAVARAICLGTLSFTQYSCTVCIPLPYSPKPSSTPMPARAAMEMSPAPPVFS